MNLFFKLLAAQENKVSLTVSPSLFPDTAHKPAMIVNDNQEKTLAPKSSVKYEVKVVAPEQKLSVGKASAVTTQERQNGTPAEKEKTTANYQEQKVKKLEVPIPSF
jgi:hypothetical protein